MKPTFVALSLLALCLAASPANAQNDVYDNGPTNGEDLGLTINFGFAVSDQFTLGTATTVNGINFATWLFPGDILESAEVSITSSEFGGTSFLDETVNFTTGSCFSNGAGFNVCNETGNFAGINLDPGSYWLNLQNASVNTGDPTFWDMNSGPSLASENSLGTIPSESFTILGTNGSGTSSTGTHDSLPEPGSITLFGSGILGLASMVRRKLF